MGPYARIVPADQVNEFFGFNALAGKMSAILGPLAFGFLSSLTGSQRVALVSVAVFFVLGGLVIATVRMPPDIAEEHPLQDNL